MTFELDLPGIGVDHTRHAVAASSGSATIGPRSNGSRIVNARTQVRVGGIRGRASIDIATGKATAC